MSRKELEKKIEDNFFGVSNLMKDFNSCLNLSPCSKRGSTKHLKLLASIGRLYF